MTQSNIYFDFNATTPVDPRVLEQVPGWLSMWGNPSSIHWHGREPKKLLREARRSLATNLQCHPLELIFTSGGSESNNLAIKGCLSEIKNKTPEKNIVILGGIEHPSVMKQIPQIQAMGFEVLLVPVNRDGSYDMKAYEACLSDKVALVSVMAANNEIGTIAPLEQMVPMAKDCGAIFHSDMVQCLGKVDIDLKTFDLDMASFSAHKVYALKGCGALYVKKGTPFIGITNGGSQERGRRAGTENLTAIAAFALMVDLIDSKKLSSQIDKLREIFEETIKETIAGVEVLACDQARLCNTSSVTIQGINGETLLMNLDIRGFSVGTGAACSSGNPEPSPVLLSMGLSREEAQSSLRVSLGKETTKEQVLDLAEQLKQVVEHLRNLAQEEARHV